MNAMQWVSLLVILKLIVKQDSIEGFSLKWILIPCFTFAMTTVVMDVMNLRWESHKWLWKDWQWYLRDFAASLKFMLQRLTKGLSEGLNFKLELRVFFQCAIFCWQIQMLIRYSFEILGVFYNFKNWAN